ncbi:MAG: AAA family ATPase, partial [Defluviitaleaceae bacterium]|nr:AAA family ATPase [Defluviitaleaceae bacterium]
FGPNGSGKTTTGRELARILGFKHIDIEDYAFLESEIPYSKPRPREEVVQLLQADITEYREFVFSTVMGNWGDIMPGYYKLAVRINAPYELRMKRIKQRSLDKYGERVLTGGDMYEQERGFFEFVKTRPISKIDEWEKTLTCPIIEIDGTESLRANVDYIVKVFEDCKTM